MVEPADEAARRLGIAPQFLAVWGAYRYIGRAGLDALERADTLSRLSTNKATTVASPIAGLEIVEVTHEDATLPAIKLLREFAGAHGTVVNGALSLSGDLKFGA